MFSHKLVQQLYNTLHILQIFTKLYTAIHDSTNNKLHHSKQLDKPQTTLYNSTMYKLHNPLLNSPQLYKTVHLFTEQKHCQNSTKLCNTLHNFFKTIHKFTNSTRLYQIAPAFTQLLPNSSSFDKTLRIYAKHFRNLLQSYSPLFNTLQRLYTIRSTLYKTLKKTLQNSAQIYNFTQLV